MSVPPSRIPWHRLSEVMTDSLLVIDRQGYYCDLNAPAQALVGRSAADLVGQPWGEELLKLLGPEFRTQYDRALDQGEAQRLEMVAPDDGRRFQVQIVPAHGVIFLCLTEITDPKTLTPALNSSTEDYRTLADIIPVGIFHTDRTGNCCYVNDRWSQITGLSLAEALGTGWLQAVYPDDRDRLTTHWHEATQTDRVFQQEYRFQDAQGQITWVFGQAVAQYDSQGHVYGYVGTITDITQHKQVEAQNLRKAQRETALNRLFQTIHNSLDLETIFSTATTEIAQTLKPWDCIVVQYLPDRGIWQHQAEFRHPDPETQLPPPPTLGLEIPDANNPFAAQLKRLEWVIVQDTNQITDPINEPLAQTSPGSWILVPLVVAGKIWGSLTLQNAQLRLQWQAEDFDLVQAVVAQLEVAIHQANLYAQAQQEIEERKRTEAALRASEVRLQNLAANIPGAICEYILYADGTEAVLYISPGCVNLWELEAAVLEANSQHLWEMVHPEDRTALRESVQTSARTFQAWNHEWRIITPSGQLKWLQATGQPQAAANGAVIWDSIILDISATKQAQQEQQSSEERYRLLAENTNDLVALHALDGRYLYISPSVELILGYEPTALLGCSSYDLFHPEDQDLIRRESHTRVLQGHTGSVTYRMRHKAGYYLWLETLTRPIIDDAGKVTQLQTSSREVTDRVRTQQQLEHQARHDSLTGLPNRAFLQERLNLALQQKKDDESYNFAVLFLDLDRFKVINDSLGHIAGDRLLIEVAHTLQILTQPKDMVARLGGDEFVVLLEGVADIADVREQTQQILNAFHQPFMLDHRTIHITPSIGVVWGDVQYENGGQLLRDADIAMYQAKDRGKACYELFSPAMHTEALDKLDLEHDLRRTLEAQATELVLYYQPIVCLHTGKIIGFEALSRWQHPTRGLIPPGLFIPLAEETGLISDIDFWAIATACQQLRQWRSRIPQAQALKLSINLSAQDLVQIDLLPLLDRVLAAGLDPAGSLTLEITESMLIDDVDTTIDRLHAFKARGIHISLDDFGTGYSSLSYLHRLPLDNLKLDRSFVQTMEGDRKNYKIIETIVTLSRQLDLHAIAEGVTTLDQLQHLRQLGYEYGQGYWFAPPLSVGEAEKLLWGEPYGVNPEAGQ